MYGDVGRSMNLPLPAPDLAPGDDELMALAAGNDRGAFSALIERHGDAVVGYLARLTGSRDRAEDLGQETFLRLFRARDRYRGEGHLVAYLFRIATNLLRSEERRERRARMLSFLWTPEEHEEPSAPRRMLENETRDEVAAAVAALPLRLRVPLVLHEIQGWPYSDVARHLGCREGTVKSRIHRGRLALRARLEPYWSGGMTWRTNEESPAPTAFSTIDA